MGGARQELGALEQVGRPVPVYFSLVAGVWNRTLHMVDRHGLVGVWKVCFSHR